MARDAGGVESGVDVRVEVGLEGREGPADAAVHLPGAMERLGVAKASLSATFHSAEARRLSLGELSTRAMLLRRRRALSSKESRITLVAALLSRPLDGDRVRLDEELLVEHAEAWAGTG